MKRSGGNNNRRLANQAIKFRNTFHVYPFHHGYTITDGEWRHHLTGAGLFDSIGNFFQHTVGDNVVNVANQAVGTVVGATTDELNQAKTQLSKFGTDFVNGLEMVAGKLATGAQVLGNWVIQHPKFFAHVVVNIGIAIAFPELAPDMAMETGGLLLTTVLQDTQGQPQPTQEDIDKMIAEAREKMMNDPTYQASIKTLGDFVGYLANIGSDYGLSVDITEENNILYIVGNTMIIEGKVKITLDRISIDINPDDYKLTLTNIDNKKVFDGANYQDIITVNGGVSFNQAIRNIENTMRELKKNAGV